jgi:hypothetical protein
VTSRPALDAWLASSEEVIRGGDPDLPDAMSCAPSDGSRYIRVATYAGSSEVLALRVGWAGLVGWTVEGDGIPVGSYVGPGSVPFTFQLLGSDWLPLPAIKSAAGTMVRLARPGEEMHALYQVPRPVPPIDAEWVWQRTVEMLTDAQRSNDG